MAKGISDTMGKKAGDLKTVYKDLGDKDREAIQNVFDELETLFWIHRGELRKKQRQNFGFTVVN